MRKLVLLLILFLGLFVLETRAQMSVTNAAPYNTPFFLINDVFSNGTVTITNVTAFGSPAQYGFFSNGMAAVGLDSGIVLATSTLSTITNSATAPNAPAPAAGVQFGFPWMGTAASNNLRNLSATVPALIGQNFTPSGNMFGASVISFDFVPTEDTMRFRFSFASAEWNTFPCTGFNDIFGFFVAGPGITGPYNAPPGYPGGAVNVAHVPGTTIPITISSITHPTLTGNCVGSNNSQYYVVGNSGGLSLAARTTVIQIEFPVTRCLTYNFTMGIANAGDGALQSAVFMEANSFGASSNFNAVIEPVYNTLGGDSIVYEGCGDVKLSFVRFDTALAADTIPLNVWGSAINGVDIIPAIPDTLYFAQGQDSIIIQFTVVYDSITEGCETLFIAVDTTGMQMIGCGGITSDTLSLVICDPIPLILAPTDTTVMCTETPVQLKANPQQGFPNYTYQWSTNVNDTLDSVSITTPVVSTDYYVTVTDACSLFSVVDTARINIVNPPTSIQAGSATIDCETPGAQIFVTTFDSMPGLQYLWSTGDTTTSFYIQNPLITTFYTVTATQACAGYTLIDTFWLTVDNPPFTIWTNNDTIDCTSDSVRISVEVSYTTPNFSFNWSNGITDSTQLVLPSSTTQYIISVTDACGQNTEIDTATIYVFNLPIVVEKVNQTIACAGDSVDIFVNVSGGYYPYFYSWSNFSTDSVQRVTTDRFSTYYVTVTDICGVDTVIDFVDVVVRSYPTLQIIPFENDTLLCPRQPFYFGPANVIGGSGNYVASWTHWADSVDALWGAPAQSQLYTLLVRDVCNLDSAQSQVYVIVPQYDPVIVNLPPDSLVCPNDTFSLFAEVSGGAGQYNYLWNTGDTRARIITSNQGQFTYAITVTDLCGNTGKNSTSITASKPTAEFDFDFIDTRNLMLDNKSKDAIMYEWRFGDGTFSDEESPWHMYSISQSYNVTLLAYNEIGCMDSISKRVDPPLVVFIPNAFSPNGDGLNDVFKINGDGLRLGSNIRKFSITIFDRWGNEVFSSKSPNFEWDGKLNGKPMPIGTYVYNIFVEGYKLQKFEQTGSITIVTFD